ncbi:MAG: HDIG domain-containing protein [Firmicutes bacterium]|nr:HDIG domain-containing protein [Bacillota bacterium]MCL1953684.1 HDIG domain-containing protein [Bacillota bacterium]
MSDSTNEVKLNQIMQHKGIMSNRSDMIKFVLIYVCTLLVAYSLTIVNFLIFDYQFGVNVYLSIFAVLAVLIATLCIYVVNSRRKLLQKKRTLMAVCFCVVLAYGVNIYLIEWSPYAMSIALCAYLISPITAKRDAFVSNLIVAFMVSFAVTIFRSALGFENVFDILGVTLAGILSGSLASYVVSNNSNRLSFLCWGILFGAFSFLATLVLMFMSIPDFQILNNLKENWHIFVIVILGTVISSQALHPFIEWGFNILTNTRLIELTSHSSPLIARLMEEAPGTFNHSMAVANFVEVCAKAIGENPFMARAAAYYHDVGKLVNPSYFTENQSNNYNPHDELLPEISADIIRRHTTDGFELCKQHRIPMDIANITLEHHGTTVIFGFYSKAKKLTDQEVDAYEYSYHNPTPKSKIAALIMICDSAEATIRSMASPDWERVDELLKKQIEGRILTGQFVNCDITIKELDIVRKTIGSIYGGIFHGRIQYTNTK